MSYVLPALQVHQEFEAIAEGTTDLLYACIVAPHYGLHRYSEDDEKTELGDYDPSITNEFTSYPDKSAGSAIDVDYNKLFFEDAVLQYASETIDGSIGADVGLLANDGNKIRSDALVFKTANDVARSGIFGSRDVQIGDPIKITVGASEFETVVAGLIADIDDATVQALPSLENAPATQTPKVFAFNTAGIGTPGTMSIAEAGTSDYSGMIDAVISEVYTCEVIETSGGVTGTKVKITSASGLDDVDELTLALTDNEIGTRGLVVDITAGGVAFVEGDTFTISIDQEYTQPAPAGDGTYTGPKDTTYIVTVVKGGTIADSDPDRHPIIQVSTTNGADAGDPVTVAALGNVAVGNYGTIITFAGGDEQLIKGSAFTLDVTAAGEGAVKTLALADRLTGIITTDELDVDFRLEADFELESDKWTSDESSITVYSGAQHTNTLLGSLETMDIISGTMFINYRELLTTFGNILSSVISIDEAATVCGPAVTDNPLGLMVNKALTNSNGIEVYFVSPDEDTDTGYIDAIDSLSDDSEPYGIVPYSNTLAVRDAVKAHCLDMSTPAKGLWRIYWISAEVERVSAVYTELAGGGDILATIDNDVVTAAGALFVTNGVVAGDVVRINYQPDAYGNEVYDEFVIDVTPTVEDELKVLNAPDIGVAVKMEVWREASKSEYADMISDIATHSNHRRGYAVWSEGLYDGLNPDGMPGSVLCAALAGLRSGVAPHQPLTQVSVSGFSLQSEVNFRATELNDMAENGVWLVLQTLAGVVYTRHQVSTDTSDINHREQTVTTNLDEISMTFKSAMSNYYGRGNVSPAMLDLIEYTAYQTITTIQSRPYSDTIGPQILDADITKLEVNPVRRDAVDLVIRPELPYPLNNLDVYFIIS